MKYVLALLIALAVNWLLWSGHFKSPFLLMLGALSCLGSVYVSMRMGIIDEEGAPAHLGLRPFTHYAPWLFKKVALSNIRVAKIILSPTLPLRRCLVRAKMSPKSELGKVMLANSITLTPGTVSAKLEDGEVLVHALSLEDAEEDIEGEMGRRIRAMERDE